MTARALLLAGLLSAAPAHALEAWANGIDGVGRISVLPGWKLTPNDWFFAKSAEAGYPTVSRGIGGPQGTFSFGYGANSFIEANIDLFIGYDRLEIRGYSPINILSYGALLGARFTFMDLFFKGFAPFIGIGVGPTLGYAFTGTESYEKLVTGFGGSAGITYRLSDFIGISAEYRFLYARANWYTSGLNVGGSWFSLGIVIYISRTPTAAERMMSGP